MCLTAWVAQAEATLSLINWYMYPAPVNGVLSALAEVLSRPAR